MKKFIDIYEEKPKPKPNPIAQRRELSRRMKKMAQSSIVKAKKARAKFKMRNPAKLKLLARKKVIQNYRDKYFPRYNDMPIPQRVKVDQKIMQKYGAKIDKVAQRMVAKLQKAEVERVKAARAAAQGKGDA